MNKIKRKFRKLMRDPKLFFKDMYLKHTTRFKKHTLIKYDGHQQYTVVSAVYNVEKYLDEFFSSITKQTINFEKNIQMILVDDGSTDNSKNIILKWKNKYPNNIHYLYKENGGQATARNYGIPYVKTKWVTFIDPDDFVSKQYFQKVDQFLVSSKKDNVSLISCPFIFYFEDKKIFKDSHPLKFRFENGGLKTPIKDLNKYFQMSVNSAFFRTNLIKKHNIRFDDIKPNFEDAKFVGDYLIKANQDNIAAFITGASYFYRKRSDGSSTLDGAWKKTALFGSVLEDGCLKLLVNAKNNLGFVPNYIQVAVLYHLAWYFKYLVNNDAVLNMLDQKEKEKFLSLLKEIFTYIDVNTIMDFSLVGTWFFHRVLYINSLKNHKMPFQISYIESIDRKNKLFQVYYFTANEIDDFKLTFAGKDINPVYKKNRIYTLADQTILFEKRLWISYEDFDPKAMFRIEVAQKQAVISLAGKQHKNGLPLRVLFRDLPIEKYLENDGSWIIMDRDTQADDNGEHFYRYLQQEHPEQKIYFALNKSSHDWKRLKNDGFNLLNFKSEKYKRQLRKSDKLISSHIDEYIANPFKDHFEFSKHFVFLQHGVTHNDLSSWLNTKRNLSLMLTTSQDEYNDLGGDKTKYKFSNKEVVLTGLPRHDALIKGNQKDSKVIVIMPTWRKTILGANAKGNKRKINNSFMDTDYAKHWSSFLSSEALQSLSEKYGYEVIFAPHANIEPYLDQFNLPKYIKPWRAKDSSIQALFQKAKFMITDYSSVAFEMGVLNKTVIYYQFDQDDFFNGGHAFQKGYFTYEKNGFGPVVYNEKDLILALKRVLKNKGNPLSPYDKRIKKTFPFRDGKCCERIYEEICKL